MFVSVLALISCNKNIAITRSSDYSHSGNIKVMSYNIHHANPPSKPNLIDIDAIVKTIKAQEPDLVALQEVDVNTARSGTINQAEQIASKLKMNVFFGKAIDYDGGEYGVAILSKFPISEAVVHQLPTKPETNGEPRILVTVKVALPGGPVIRFANTHLDAQKDSVNRQMQMEKILAISSTDSLPFIIGGDFNATPETGVIKALDNSFIRTCNPCAPTFLTNASGAPIPLKVIDFIAYKHPSDNFSLIDHQVVEERYASDHMPIVAVINI